MKKKHNFLYWAVSLLSLSSVFQSVYAADAFDASSQWMFGDWNGKRTQLQQQGYDFSLGYTGEMATLLHAKQASSHGTEYADQFAIGSHLDLEKILGWQNTEAQITVTERNGRSLSQRSDALAGHLSSSQEVWGRGQTWRLTDFWIKKKFLDQKLDVKVGRFGEGEDFNSFDCDFQNLALCGSQVGNWVGDQWYNWPVSQWAAWIKYNLQSDLYAQVGVYEYNPENLERGKGWNLSTEGSHGAIIPAEVVWTPKVGTQKLDGEYRAGYYYSTADAQNINHPEQTSHKQGMWMIAKQQLTAHQDDPHRGLTGFVNVTVHDSDTNTVGNMQNIGLVYKPCTDFGHNGEVDLQKDMPFPYPGGYIPTSPPVVTGTTIIIAGSTTDNYSTEEPSGVIRGYDVNTGDLLWVFDTGAEDPNKIPAPGQKYVQNSPNAWAPLAYDAKLDIVYVPTGVGTPDIWGGNRTELHERYANSMLAINATTGKLVWNFQTTHHDLWDMDVPSQPTLADIQDKSGQTIPAIYVLTKTGNAFVLDRRTGKAVVPITEKPVPKTVKLGPQTKGEHYSATQPFSDFDLAPKDKLTDKQMWGATMFDQLICRVSFHKLNYDGIYTPPSENGTLVFPGNLGVFEWGGMSVNPDRQIAVMNPIGLPFVTKLIPADPNRKQTAKGAGTEAGVQPMYGVPYGVEISPFLSPFGLPCKQPAWGYVAGVDLKTHDIAWKRRIGTIRDSLPGIPLPPFKMGVPMLGGSISTAGNLMFVGGTQDNYIRAIKVTNGDELWKGRLPAGGQATPMTYESKGKQYVVIMAGGHGSFGTKMGDALVAYALPDQK